MVLNATSPADRRVLRTQRALREALIALIAEKGWDGFGVEELCVRADVGRSTFYLHFAGREDVVVAGLEELGRGLRAQVAAQGGPPRPLAFSRPMIEHACGNRRAFHALLGKGSGEAVQRRLDELVVGLVRDDLTGLLASGRRKSAATHFLAGGFLELLAWGLGSESTADPEELERLFQQLAAPVLGALRAP